MGQRKSLIMNGKCKNQLDGVSQRGSGLDVKNRTETGQSSSSKKKARLGKDDVRYWKQRLKKRTYSVGGEKIEIKEWQIRLYENGREEWFNLESENQTAAAQKAREIYRYLKANGMEEAVNAFKPKAVVEKGSMVTLGDYIKAAEEHAFLNPQTLHHYVRRARQIVGDLLEVTGGRAKYDYVNGGSQKRRAKIDGRKLSFITDEKIAAWKLRLIQKAGTDPVQRKKTEHTCNSCLRNAKALFGKKIVRRLKDAVDLPEDLPFQDVEYFRQSPFKYRSKVDIEAVLDRAKSELKTAAPDLFKILLLGVFVGLRRKEIDMLTWSAFDWDAEKICVRASKYHELKSDSSEDDVPVESSVLQLFRDYYEEESMGDSEPPEFVIYSAMEARRSSTYSFYRAESQFKELIGWLRENGINAQKPLHTLRKEFGRLITEKHGIFAASKLLRHSSIQVTASHYADDTRHLTTGLGRLVSD